MKTQDKALVLGVLLAVASAAAVVAWKADQVSTAPGKLQVLVLYESGDLTPAVSSVIGSTEIRKYMATHGVEGTNFLCLDKDDDLSSLPAVWKQMADEKPKILPCIIVQVGRKMYSGTLPDTVADTLKLLKQYGGE